MFATILHRYAQIRDAFAKVLDSSFADSRRIRESSRRIRDRFGQVRASSRKFAQVRDAFADSRRIRGFAQVRASSRRVCADSRRIRDGFAPSSHGFATGLRKFATDSRRVRTSSHKFAPDITQFRDANARRGHVTSPVSWLWLGTVRVRVGCPGYPKPPMHLPSPPATETAEGTA